MAYDPEKITFFAKTDARGSQVPFGIKAKDRQRHMYVVGKTGMGKSTLLENMAVQDIQNGEGMAFIDPHGSAAETLLEYVPEHRINDVIYFAPFDMENPISFNVMEDVGPDKRHLVVSGLMSTFKKIWVDAWSARMEYILTNALLALIEYPDTTLLSVNRLFNDKAYRTKVVDYIKDPAVKAFWVDEFANYTERFAAEALPAIQNKIGQFTGNPLIRNIIGQPHSSFDIRQIMDERKILIMNLSKGLVGETNANLLGSMLTTRIYLAAMSRADLPVDVMRKMPNFYFYVDEFQSFANATFANILSEARKYHLNLIIAHQYIAQMEEEVRDAVFGNVGTTAAFRVGPFDAEVLETVFTPRFLAADLVNLGFAQIYLTLMIDGIGSQPFSAVTLPPIERPRVSCKDMVIAASRRNYTKPRAEVEKVVTELHTPVAPPPPPPRPKPASAGPTQSYPPRANDVRKKDSGPVDRPRPVLSSPTRLPSPSSLVVLPKTPAPLPVATNTNGDDTKQPAEKDGAPRPPIQDRKDSQNRTDRSNRSFEADARPKVEKAPMKDSSPLNDLRAVLAKISGDATPSRIATDIDKPKTVKVETRQTERTISSQQSVTVTSVSTPKDDLRSALSAALAAAPQTAVPPPPVVADARAELLAMEREVEAHLEHINNVGTLPSAKTVERMMKGDDRGRTPFS
ncbi:type IV secretion system DNA-binding domain-containing protein [Patescibacteria group bacterium]|nr:type IV secretion system DNA-binding domain-containing protein [Patescibacteria group bacterium]